MIYNEACGEKLSRLGFGCMRLPLGSDGEIDEVRLNAMVDNDRSEQRYSGLKDSMIRIIDRI